jgi:exopolysaccharide biosynthesis protein
MAVQEEEYADIDENGFLLEGEDIYENAEEGIWHYNSPNLRIDIVRYYDAVQNLTWTEAEIFARNDNIFRMVPYHRDQWMKSQNWPETIARENHVIFAVNSDFAHVRIAQKSIVGIVIRDSKTISDRTKRKGSSGFPNLDTLALFMDGDMRVFDSNEFTAKQYLQLGAVDVLAFGPYLIRDGRLNETAILKYGSSRAPRTAVGMIEKGHYYAMMLEGRHEKSRGAGISFLANKLYEKGCIIAMNLDGGQTATMLFMGKQIITVGQTTVKDASARRTAEILGIGYSEQVR